MKEQIYKVEGMHCASCEILIEKELLDIPGVKSVDASTGQGKVVVQYEEQLPTIEKINEIFKKNNYKFFNFSTLKHQSSESNEGSTSQKINTTLFSFNIAVFIVVAFLILQKIGIADFLNLTSSSSLIAIFGFGLLASISSCAALVGGIILSMSKQWNNLYAENSSTSKKLQPHIMFNFGRLVSYALLGGVLGLIGSQLQISLQFTSFLIIAISFLMIAIGLQMLGVKAFQKFQLGYPLGLPKNTTRFIANENNFQGKYMPFLMGAATFILPCGFTITAQSIALLSGNFLNGALIMGMFALGTVPSLLFIGMSSIKFSSKPHMAEKFSKVAGFLLLFFALFNISSQMNVLGFTGFNFPQKQTPISQEGLAPIVNDKQIIKMNASSRGYSPNYFKVKVGIPVRWEITDTGTSGCTNAVISKSLFDGDIRLTPGKTSIKEFTPQKIGKHKFSCWMGMVSGTIEVIN